MPLLKDERLSSQESGIMGAIAAVAEGLLVGKTFICWQLAPNCRREFLRKIRENVGTLTAYADDLEKLWASDEAQR